MSRLWTVIKGALGVVAILTFATLCWVGAFFCTSWGYSSLGVQPTELTRQVITSLTGVVFMFTPALIYGASHRPREIDAFQSVFSAIRRISKGDFGVRVETRLRGRNHPFNQFAESINDMAVELDHMERLRQEFISSVSHEIQSPLTSIGGFAKALRDARLGSEQRGRYLDIIETETSRLSKLSGNLLKLTALEAEHSPLEPVRYRLDRQMRRIILASEPQWREKDIELDVALEAVTIVADQPLMDQVWINLLHNAVKFTPPGGTITIRLARQEGYAAVEVIDTGVGISQADQERIFERFYKVDPARNRQESGSGLGLALVKRIVELHGGNVSVRSELGRGTIFTVTNLSV